MMKHTPASRFYWILAFLLLILGAPSQSNAQFITVDIDSSNCNAYITLADSFSQLPLSNHPPYFISVGSIQVNSNAIAASRIDISSLNNGANSIIIIDGQQNFYQGSLLVTCGQAISSPPFVLFDTLFSAASSCLACDGAAGVNLTNPAGGNFFAIWSDGDTTAAPNGQSIRNDLCPGNYTVRMVDANTGAQAVIALQVPCTNSPPAPNALCTQGISTFYLDRNGQLQLFPQDISINFLDPRTVESYLVHDNQTVHDITFNCQDMGYQQIDLLLVDPLSRLTDICTKTIEIRDTFSVCNSNTPDNTTILFSDSIASDCQTCNAIYNFSGIARNNIVIGSNFTLLWNDGNTSSSRFDLCPGVVYQLEIRDDFGGIYHQTITPGCPPNTPNACIDSATIDLSLNCPTIYAPVCGCNQVTYQNACIAQFVHGVTTWTTGVCNSSSFGLEVNTTPSNPCDSAGCTGAAIVSPIGGIPPYSFIWSDTALSGGNQTGLCEGNYIVTVIDSIGDSTSAIVTIGIENCVWPGDADHNTVANNFDLLSIALRYNATGPVRFPANTNWAPQTASFWGNTPNFMPVNDRHVDCDGNGTIDSLDVDVIELNYGRTHYRSNNNSLFGNVPFAVDQVTASPGDSISVPIILGNTQYPATNAYAVAFTINYDPEIIAANTIIADFSNSWLGNDLLEIQKNYEREGRLEVAIGRKDGQPIIGMGRLAHVSFTIKDRIIVRQVIDQDSIDSPLGISDIRLITADNIEIGTNPNTGAVKLRNIISGIRSTPTPISLRYYPNPTNKWVQLECKNTIIDVIKLYNPLGQLVKMIPVGGKDQCRVTTEDLDAGMYFMQIQTPLGQHTSRLRIVR